MANGKEGHSICQGPQRLWAGDSDQAEIQSLTGGLNWAECGLLSGGLRWHDIDLLSRGLDWAEVNPRQSMSQISMLYQMQSTSLTRATGIQQQQITIKKRKYFRRTVLVQLTIFFHTSVCGAALAFLGRPLFLRDALDWPCERCSPHTLNKRKMREYEH